MQDENITQYNNEPEDLTQDNDAIRDSVAAEQYRAEISAMGREIADLRQQLDSGSMLDKFDPFGNDTEYRQYNSDYTEIVPQIAIPGCKIPTHPNLRERKSIRKFYHIAGLNMLFSVIAFNILFFAIGTGFTAILSAINPDAKAEAIGYFQYDSSLLIAMNLIVFLICNVTFSLLGLKMAKIKLSTLIRTTNFDPGKAIQYCMIATFLTVTAGYLSGFITEMISGVGLQDYDVSDIFVYESMTGKFLTLLYTCIIAPITEELFCRGMLLKTLSKANQRFGIIMTAIIFGLMHHNIAQFSLGFIIGIFLAHITLKHNSIIPAVIVHMYINTFSYITGEADSFGLTNLYELLSLAYIILAFAGLITFIIFKIENKLPATTPAQSRRGFSLASTSIPFIAAFAVHIFLTVSNILYASM